MTNHPNRSKRPKWQPIETAPRDNLNVVLYTPAPHNAAITVGYFDTVRMCWFIGCTGLDRQRTELFPTHWMPLPPPPEASRRRLKMRPARPFVLLAEAYLAFIVLLEVGVTLTAAAMHNLNGAHAAWMIGASCIALAALDVARRAPSPSTP